VYHDLIPVVCHFLGFKRGQILTALLLGSTVPLGMFLAFEAVCLGLVPFTAGVAVDPLEVIISTQGPVAGTAVAVFSLAALATSAIGTTLSLTSFFKTKLETLTSINQLPLQLPQLPSLPSLPLSEATKVLSPASASTPSPTPAHVCAVLLTLTPPTIASMSGTGIFMTATHLAGAYGMTVLYGLLPPLLAWSLRRNGGAKAQDGGQLLPGGEPILASLFAAGIAVFGLQLKADVSFDSAGTESALPAQEIGQLPLQVATDFLTSVSTMSDGLMHGAVRLM
jgi:tyrosine-specific transport protein